MRPEPGIYPDVEFEDYLKWDAVSNSRLKLADQSLAHYRTGWVGGETKALRLGSLTHCGQLEPLELAKRYAVMPDYHRHEDNVTLEKERSYAKTTKYYIAKSEQFREANKDKQIVSASDYDEMMGIVSSLASNEHAMSILGAKGQVEVSIVWNDPETGLLCKGRFDKLMPGKFGDLKTSADAKGFEKGIIKFGYHRQMALYQQGYEVLTGEILEPNLIAVETSEPYCSRSAPVCEALLEDGRKEVAELLRKVAVAIETDQWPGYENPSAWDGPDFYTRKRNFTKPVEATIGGKKVIF